jgi:hypothetical protein
MAATITTADKILKFIYSSRALQNAVYDKNPLFALLPKSSGFNGRSMIHALTYGNSLARSAAFGTAQGRAGINGVSGTDSGFNRDVNFTVTRVKNYAMYTIEQELLLAASGDRASFVKGLTQLVDGTLQTLRNDFGRDVYGSGLGELGQVTAVSGSGPYTFTVGEAITQIEVGMELVASAGSTRTNILRTGAAPSVTVATVNRAAGTFTTPAQVTDPIVANDWLFIRGDRPDAATTAIGSMLKIAGMDAWNPSTTPPGSESFFGVDRSIDATRLAGQRLDISSLQPEEGYVTALAALAREDGDPSHIFTSFTDEKNLKLALGSRVDAEYTQVGDIGFESIRLRGPNGTVKVYADRNAPVGRARILTLNTWELKHLGDLVNNGSAGNDGGLAREYQADRFEGRMSFYGNLICHKPAANMVAALPT